MGKQIVLENVRINWPRIAKPEGNPNFPDNAPTYSVVAMLDPEEHSDYIAEIEKAMESIASDASGKMAKQTLWEESADKANGVRELRASAPENWRRQVVDEQLNPVSAVLTQQKFYSGCRCNVAVDIYPTKFKKIGVGLLAIQFLADDEPLSGAPEAGELFKPIPVAGGKPKKNPLG